MTAIPGQLQLEGRGERGCVTGRLRTAREVADQIGVSAETVLRWTRKGKLPGVRLPGGAIRYREDELDGWLEERATPRQGGATQPRRTPPGGHATAPGVGLAVQPNPEGKED